MKIIQCFRCQLPDGCQKCLRRVTKFGNFSCLLSQGAEADFQLLHHIVVASNCSFLGHWALWGKVHESQQCICWTNEVAHWSMARAFGMKSMASVLRSVWNDELC